MAREDTCNEAQGVMNQVDRLFSTIALLPAEIRDATLQRIRSKLESDVPMQIIKIECSSWDEGVRLGETQPIVETPRDVEVMDVTPNGNHEPNEPQENFSCSRRPARMCPSRYASVTTRNNDRLSKAAVTAKANINSSRKMTDRYRAVRNPKSRKSKEMHVETTTSNDKQVEDVVPENKTTAAAALTKNLRTGTKKRACRRLSCAKTKKVLNDNSNGEVLMGENKDDGENVDQLNGDIPMRIFTVPTNFRQKDVNKLPSNGVVQSNDEGETDEQRPTKTCYGCTQCSRNFLARTHLIIHMRTHTGETPHVCTKCGRGFTQRSSLNIHLQAHDGVANHKCPHCAYRALRKIDMLRHIARKHSTERNFSCDVCGKSFTTDVAFKEHMRYVHERSSRHMCHLCGYITHRADNLQRHLRTSHSTLERHECPVCGRLINQRGTFLAHLRTHTGERPYACSKCDKAFKSHSQLTSHMLTHGAATFQCETCQRMFKTRFHLTRHSVVHTGEKPYACPYCKYTCNVPNNMNKHVRSVHGILEYSWGEMQRRQQQEHQNQKDDVEVTDAAAAAAADSHRTDVFVADRAKEKGKIAAEHFLERLSLRKEEGLTVSDLRQKLEAEQTSQKTTNLGAKTKRIKSGEGKNETTKKLAAKKQKRKRCAKKTVKSEENDSCVKEGTEDDPGVVVVPDVAESEMASAVLVDEQREEVMDVDGEIVHADVFIEVEEQQTDADVDAGDGDGATSPETVVFLIECQDAIISEHGELY